MNYEDLANLQGTDNPVLCWDGKFGMLVVRDPDSEKCGVQVHGEEMHRWIQLGDLEASPRGALRQSGSPAQVPKSVQSDPVQMLLLMDWMTRGGSMIPRK